jgi:hypothetical protein
MKPLQLREKLISVYPKSERWRKRVNKMTDKQVLAVLFRMRLEGKV